MKLFTNLSFARVANISAFEFGNIFVAAAEDAMRLMLFDYDRRTVNINLHGVFNVDAKVAPQLDW